MHVPVFQKEVIEYLDLRSGQTFIDATADGGGHLIDIVKRIMPKGKIVGVETDGTILRELQEKIKNTEYKESVELVHDSYTNVDRVVKELKIKDVRGILFDLGLSSIQLEMSKRGFSFQRDEPLDMRFDPERNNLKASDLINHATPKELETIFKEYGEERFSRQIAGSIVSERKFHPILRTGDLVEAIRKGIPYPAQKQKIHFATRIFQAVRMAVNHESENIREGLAKAIEILQPGGRIAVISFHSIEDRIVKNILRDSAKVGTIKIILKKPLTPSWEEISKNPRARSAKLRVAEKI